MSKSFSGLFGGFQTYASKEFSLSGVQTNYNVATGQTTFTKPAERVVIRCDVDMTIKINATGNDAITVNAANGFDSAGLITKILNVFITTTGTTAVKILLVPGATGE